MTKTKALHSLTEVLDRHLTLGIADLPVPVFEEEVQKSVDYLVSDEAIENLKRDPYWPKWNSPWWHMTLLFEIGQGKKIPKQACDRMTSAINDHYMHIFPSSKDLPEDGEVLMYIPCHCAVGTMYKILSTHTKEIDKQLGWMREWMVRYQLTDGGLNCDEAAYSKVNGKSSITSTVPTLEAMMMYAPHPLSKAENDFIDRGAQYLLDHKLACAKATGKTINEAWLNPAFPRFYEYDVLRGLDFILAWSLERKTPIPLAAIEDVVMALAERFDPKSSLGMARNRLLNEKTRIKGIDGSWKHSSSVSLFPLLQSLVKSDACRRILGRQWISTLGKLQKSLELNLISDTGK